MKNFLRAMPFALLFFANIAAGPSRISYEVENAFHSDFRGTPKLLFNVDYRSNQVGIHRGSLARSFISDSSRRFRVLPGDMVLVKSQKSLSGQHYRFQQMLSGYEVLGGEIVVSLDSEEKKITRVFSSAFPVSEEQRSFAGKSAVSLSEEQAYDILWNDLVVQGQLLEAPAAQRAFLPQKDGFRLVYKVSVAVEKPFGYWQYLLDAETGKIIERRDRRLARKPVIFPKWGEKRGEAWPRLDEFKKFAAQVQAPARAQNLSRASGKGLVFDPDPRTTLMNNDIQDDSPAEMFEAAYFSRPLLDIGFDGSQYSLSGPWVQIADFERPNTVPSTSPDGNWSQKRGDNAFNDVMTYYHIDKNQRYMQSLGFVGDKGIQAVSIEIDSDGVNGSDNSHFVPSSNRIAFGHGCVDDNEDADVILHEYGHAIHFSINSNWSGGDTGAMGEGFGDYWAGSYSISTDNGSDFNIFDVFTWDGHGEGSPCWDGRRMNRFDVSYDHSRNYGAHVPIENGAQSDELWSTPLFQALLTLMERGYPRENVDRIILEAHFGLGSGLKMRDMANAIVQTATRLYPNDEYADVFVQKFVHHGILELPAAKFGSSGFRLSNAGDNGQADPGEIVDLHAVVKNQGNHEADQIVGTLSSSTEGVEVLNNPVSFSSAGVGEEAESASPFKVRLADSLACGADADFEIKLEFNGGASREQSVSFRMPTGVPRGDRAVSESGDIAIPDANTDGVSSVIHLDSDEHINSMKIGLDLAHTFVGDLTITLKAPSGKTLKLHSRTGGSQSDIQGVYPTTLTPADSLDGFAGEAIRGEWTLTVVDSVARDTGVLKSWSIEAVAGYDCE